jgi:maltose-binding protein MalE
LHRSSNEEEPKTAKKWQTSHELYRRNDPTEEVLSHHIPSSIGFSSAKKVTRQEMMEYTVKRLQHSTFGPNLPTFHSSRLDTGNEDTEQSDSKEATWMESA